MLSDGTDTREPDEGDEEYEEQKGKGVDTGDDRLNKIVSKYVKLDSSGFTCMLCKRFWQSPQPVRAAWHLFCWKG